MVAEPAFASRGQRKNLADGSRELAHQLSTGLLSDDGCRLDEAASNMTSQLKQENATSVRVAIVSDVHVQADPTMAGVGGHYAAAMPTNDPKRNPFEGALALIKSGGLRADVLLCCGDLADRAAPVALVDGWTRSHQMADALGATLVSTSGNHDVDSRFAHNDHDALGTLKALNPLFPVDDYHLANEYWARHFTVLEAPKYRILIVNSAAYHGYDIPLEASNKARKKYVPPEYEHGRIAESTLNSMKERFDSLENKPVNLLVCHHHVDKLDEIADSDYSAIDGAGRLLDWLSTGAHGEWSIFNGHRHVAKFTLPGPTLESPFSFTAASFAKNLVDYPIDGLDNQFYLVEFDIEAAAELKLRTAARFRSWSWRAGQGWCDAPNLMSLPDREVVMPDRGGFGFRGDPDSLRQKILDEVRTSDLPYVSLDELRTAVPLLEFVPPYSLRRLIGRLRSEGQLGVAVDGMTIQLSFLGDRDV